MRDLTKEGPFGRLTAIRSVGRKYGRNYYFLCLCKCGGVVEVRGSTLVSGDTKSCGCLQRENCAAVGRRTGGWNKTHGASGTPTFNSWSSMIRRCYDPSHIGFHRYGGRGILVCDRWFDFENFLADMGERPDGTTLNRLNNDGPYEKGNCEWATNREQQTNKSTNVRLTHDGITMTLVEWAEALDINRKTIWTRLNILGWSVAKALTEPVQNERN